jgi:hypothetical protein
MHHVPAKPATITLTGAINGTSPDTSSTHEPTIAVHISTSDHPLARRGITAPGTRYCVNG